MNVINYFRILCCADEYLPMRSGPSDWGRICEGGVTDVSVSLQIHIRPDTKLPDVIPSPDIPVNAPIPDPSPVARVETPYAQVSRLVLMVSASKEVESSYGRRWRGGYGDWVGLVNSLECIMMYQAIITPELNLVKKVSALPKNFLIITIPFFHSLTYLFFTPQPGA